MLNTYMDATNEEQTFTLYVNNLVHNFTLTADSAKDDVVSVIVSRMTTP